MEPHMEWQAILEDDPETGHVTATVAGIPQIIVDVSSEAEALQMVHDALEFYLEELDASGQPRPTFTGKAKVVPVDG